MLDNRIHVCPIDRTEAHAECLFVYPLFRHRHVVRPVEVGDDTVGEVRVGVVVLVYQIVQHIERLELVVRIIVLTVSERVKVTHGYFPIVVV